MNTDEFQERFNKTARYARLYPRWFILEKDFKNKAWYPYKTPIDPNPRKLGTIRTFIPTFVSKIDADECLGEIYCTNSENRKRVFMITEIIDYMRILANDGYDINGYFPVEV